MPRVLRDHPRFNGMRFELPVVGRGQRSASQPSPSFRCNDARIDHCWDVTHGGPEGPALPLRPPVKIYFPYECFHPCAPALITRFDFALYSSEVLSRRAALADHVRPGGIRFDFCVSR